jgi:ribosomal 30S subunit maturation factor RimM
VKDTAGRAIGRVTGVEGPLERSLLIVAGGRGEVMVPMANGIVVNVDTVARQIVVELPEGLMDLNSAPRTSGSE